MSPIEHLDVVVTSPETSLAFHRGLLDYTPGHNAVFFRDPDAITLELVHRPSERDLAAQVRQLKARLERLEQARP